MSFAPSISGGGAGILSIEQPEEGVLRFNLTDGTHFDVTLSGSAPGADGRTIHNGDGAPGGGLGANGDFYIDTTAVALYGPKAAGAWPAAVVLKGNTVLNGTVAPGAGVGRNGDFYLNTATSIMYGPKAAGAWPAGWSLKGAVGATGAAGRWPGLLFDWADGGTPAAGNPHNGTSVDHAIGLSHGLNNFGLAEFLWMTVHTWDGIDVRGTQATYVNSTSAVKGRVTVTCPIHPDFLMSVDITAGEAIHNNGPGSGGTYWNRWAIVPVELKGTWPAQFEPVVVNFVPAGDKGNTGGKGDKGDPGDAANEDRLDAVEAAAAAAGTAANTAVNTANGAKVASFDMDVLRAFKQKIILGGTVASVTGTVDLGNWAGVLTALGAAVGNTIKIEAVREGAGGIATQTTYTVVAGHTVANVVAAFNASETPITGDGDGDLDGHLIVSVNANADLRISGSAALLTALGLEAAATVQEGENGDVLDADKVGFSTQPPGVSAPTVQQAIAAITAAPNNLLPGSPVYCGSLIAEADPTVRLIEDKFYSAGDAWIVTADGIEVARVTAAAGMTLGQALAALCCDDVQFGILPGPDLYKAQVYYAPQTAKTIELSGLLPTGWFQSLQMVSKPTTFAAQLGEAFLEAAGFIDPYLGGIGGFVLVTGRAALSSDMLDTLGVPAGAFMAIDDALTGTELVRYAPTDPTAVSPLDAVNNVPADWTFVNADQSFYPSVGGDGQFNASANGLIMVRVRGTASLLDALGIRAGYAIAANLAAKTVNAALVGFNNAYTGAYLDAQEAILGLEASVDTEWPSSVALPAGATNLTKAAHSRLPISVGNVTAVGNLQNSPSNSAVRFRFFLTLEATFTPDLTLQAIDGDRIKDIDGTIALGTGSGPSISSTDPGAYLELLGFRSAAAGHQVTWRIIKKVGVWTLSA